MNNVAASNGQVYKFFLELLDYHAENSLRLTKALSSITSDSTMTINILFTEKYGLYITGDSTSIALKSSPILYR